jgi:nucleoid DNA-binding protein
MIKACAEAARVTQKQAGEVLDAFVREVRSNAETVIRGFGTFRFMVMPERKARNPKTGETVIVPERTVLRFKPACAKEIRRFVIDGARRQGEGLR